MVFLLHIGLPFISEQMVGIAFDCILVDIGE